jgi:hypothetical protein
MRYIKAALFLGVLTFCVTSVQAKGAYIGFGLGLHPDMNSFANTFLKDGLESGVGKAWTLGSYNSPLYWMEVPGKAQQVVMPENELQAMQKITMNAIQVKSGGPLMGALLSVFYESEGDGSFWRVGINYSKKFRGGHTEATLIKVRWYNIDIDAKYMVVPFYYGFKAGVGDKGSAYGGIGLNYWWGQWELNGSNIGDYPTAVLGSLAGGIGAHTVTGADGKRKGGAIVNESMTFKGKGIGFNALVGFEGKIGGGNSKLFFEMEYILSGDQSKTLPRARTAGTASHLASFIQYPVAPAGWMLKFGYKMAL